MANLDKMAHHKGKRRPNDAPFRNEVMEARGQWCRAAGEAPGCEGPIQAAHIWAKSQMGPSVVENGLPMCRAHHTAYDGYRMELRSEWLDDDQIAWLAEVGYCRWDATGAPYGRGMARFANRLPAPGGQERKGPQ